MIIITKVVGYELPMQKNAIGIVKIQKICAFVLTGNNAVSNVQNHIRHKTKAFLCPRPSGRLYKSSNVFTLILTSTYGKESTSQSH